MTKAEITDKFQSRLDFLLRAGSWFAPSASLGKVTEIRAAWENICQDSQFSLKILKPAFPEQSDLETLANRSGAEILLVSEAQKEQAESRIRILQEFSQKIRSCFSLVKPGSTFCLPDSGCPQGSPGSPDQISFSAKAIPARSENIIGRHKAKIVKCQ